MHIDAQEAVLSFRNGSVRSVFCCIRRDYPGIFLIRYVDMGGYTCFGSPGEDYGCSYPDEWIGRAVGAGGRGQYNLRSFHSLLSRNELFGNLIAEFLQNHKYEL